MSKKSGLLTKLLETATFGSLLLGTSAFGGEAPLYSSNEGLNNWAKTTSALVSQNMAPIRGSIKNNDQGVTHLRVTIDEDGDVLSSSLVRSSGSNKIDSAAEFSLQKITKFPAIPASYNASSLTFGVRMVYANSKDSLARINEGLATRVRTEEVLASAGGVDVLALGK